MDDNDYVLAFDHFYTNNHIQILKSLLPFIENDNSNKLPVFIKYMELQYTISLCNEGKQPVKDGLSACSKHSSDSNFDFSENLEKIYHAIHKYLAPDEEKSISQLLSAFNTMKNIREMQQMMEMFQSMNPDINLGESMENINNLGNLNLNNMDITDIMQLINGIK